MSRPTDFVVFKDAFDQVSGRHISFFLCAVGLLCHIFRRIPLTGLLNLFTCLIRFPPKKVALTLGCLYWGQSVHLMLLKLFPLINISSRSYCSHNFVLNCRLNKPLKIMLSYLKHPSNSCNRNRNANPLYGTGLGQNKDGAILGKLLFVIVFYILLYNSLTTQHSG